MKKLEIYFIPELTPNISLICFYFSLCVLDIFTFSPDNQDHCYLPKSFQPNLPTIVPTCRLSVSVNSTLFSLQYSISLLVLFFFFLVYVISHLLSTCYISNTRLSLYIYLGCNLLNTSLK